MESHSDVQINWQSDDTIPRINPRLDRQAREQAERLLAQAPKLSGHLWVQSSGSTSTSDESAKWIALSKKAFLSSAEAVNLHLDATASDRWGLTLPTFHVSGLSILARCFLAGSSFTRFSGEGVSAFHAWLVSESVSLLSLVPTQLFDLVSGGYRSPASLRAVVLGGARLEKDLYEKARALGWPVLPSFGMTEFCSQIATAGIESPDLRLLSHIEARVDEDQTLWIKSPALFTGFLQERQGQIHWETPALHNGFWKTPDRAQLANRIIEPLGRAGDYVKIKGEGVNLSELRSRFHVWLVKNYSATAAANVALAAIPDSREGHRLVLAYEKDEGSLPKAIEDWNNQCFPIERMLLQKVGTIPRSSLGKIQWGLLQDRLRQSS